MAYIDQLTPITGANVLDADIAYLGRPGDGDPDRRITWLEAAIALLRRAPSGSAAAPGVAFASEAGMGLYRQSPNVMSVATNGVRRAAFFNAAPHLRVDLGGTLYGAWHAGNLPYEVGTWTPTITGSVSNPTVTFGTRVGTYARIGNRCLLSFDVPITTISGGSGNAYISGIPFNAADSFTEVASLQTRNVTFGAGRTAVSCLPEGSNTRMLIQTHGSATSQSSVTIADIAADSRFRGFVAYRI